MNAQPPLPALLTRWAAAGARSRSAAAKPCAHACTPPPPPPPPCQKQRHTNVHTAAMQVYVVHHTDCGMVTFTSEQLQGIVKERLGHDDDTHYHEFR